jgi:hypothetical protein
MRGTHRSRAALPVKFIDSRIDLIVRLAEDLVRRA